MTSQSLCVHVGVCVFVSPINAPTLCFCATVCRRSRLMLTYFVNVFSGATVAKATCHIKASRDFTDAATKL